MPNDVDSASPDSLTIIRAPGRRLAKLMRPNLPPIGYDSTRIFDLFPVGVPNLDALARLLRRLGSMPECAVVRGAIADPARSRRVRRLLHPDRETGDLPTLVEVRRASIGFDMDQLPLPPGCDWRDLAQCATLARAALPPVFHAAAMVAMATASHGFKAGARLRLWSLFDTPLSGSELKYWLRDTPCDRSVFNAAQPIYTAAPQFAGMDDPLPQRLIVLPGRERVICPSPSSLALPRRTPRPVPLQRGQPGSGGHASHALARAALVVASAPIDQRHATAVAEAWRLAGLVDAGLLTGTAVAEVLDIALQRAGKPEGEGAAIAAWAITQCCTETGTAR